MTNMELSDLQINNDGSITLKDKRIEFIEVYESIKTAYSAMTYDMFLEVLNGRDDPYWQEQWDCFRTMMSPKGMGRLGSFFIDLAMWGHDKRTSRK